MFIAEEKLATIRSRWDYISFVDIEKRIIKMPEKILGHFTIAISLQRLVFF